MGRQCPRWHSRCRARRRGAWLHTAWSVSVEAPVFDSCCTTAWRARSRGLRRSARANVGRRNGVFSGTNRRTGGGSSRAGCGRHLAPHLTTRGTWLVPAGRHSVRHWEKENTYVGRAGGGGRAVGCRRAVRAAPRRRPRFRPVRFWPETRRWSLRRLRYRGKDASHVRDRFDHARERVVLFDLVLQPDLTLVPDLEQRP